MNRVNWTEAKLLYVSDSRYSYRILSDKYGVSKAVIQKRATKEDWRSARRVYLDESVTAMVNRNKEGFTERYDSHLKHYGNLQAVANNLIIKADIAIKEGRLNDGYKILKGASKILKTGIDGEREILGLAIKNLPINPDNDERFKKNKRKKRPQNEDDSPIIKAISITEFIEQSGLNKDSDK